MSETLQFEDLISDSCDWVHTLSAVSGVSSRPSLCYSVHLSISDKKICMLLSVMHICSKMVQKLYFIKSIFPSTLLACAKLAA